MSELAKSCMQFKGYEVNEIIFHLYPNYVNENELKITPSFKMNIASSNTDEYNVQLIFSLQPNDENPLPFSMDVTMTGFFEIKMDTENEILKQTLLHENTVAIMFPFLRAIIASLTSTANINPLILPVINLSNSFKNETLKSE